MINYLRKLERSERKQQNKNYSFWFIFTQYRIIYCLLTENPIERIKKMSQIITKKCHCHRIQARNRANTNTFFYNLLTSRKTEHNKMNFYTRWYYGRPRTLRTVASPVVVRPFLVYTSNRETRLLTDRREKLLMKMHFRILTSRFNTAA